MTEEERRRRDQEWFDRDARAWDAAAAELEAQGYRCTGRHTRLPIFKKAGHPDLFLGRTLGKIDWRPIER